MKMLSMLTLTALISVTACSHKHKEKCCDGKDKMSCEKDSKKSCCKDKDKKCTDESCKKKEENK